MRKEGSSQLFIPPLSHTSSLLSHYEGLIFKLQMAVMWKVKSPAARFLFPLI